MKTQILQWVALRLFLVLSLAARFGVAYCVARHFSVPIQDALIGVLLFTASWTDTQLYFHLHSRALPRKSIQTPAQKEIQTHEALSRTTPTASDRALLSSRG